MPYADFVPVQVAAAGAVRHKLREDADAVTLQLVFEHFLEEGWVRAPHAHKQGVGPGEGSCRVKVDVDLGEGVCVDHFACRDFFGDLGHSGVGCFEFLAGEELESVSLVLFLRYVAWILVGGVEEVCFLGFVDWDGVWDGAEGEEAVVGACAT